MSKQTVTNIRQPYKALPPEHAAFAKGTVSTPVPTEILLDILRRPRFADSTGELYVIETYIKTLPGVQMDSFGNFWLAIAQADGSEATTLFSAHTDTVHKAKATGTYKLAARDGMLSVKGGGVLGADDGTGIWILLNLIAAKVPGLYIFHREEEIGGNGSTFIAQHYTHILEKYHRAVAFDRKGTRDIITHQGGERCCSDAFAAAFAEQLNAPLGIGAKGETEGFAFRGDDGGSFTDTKNYTRLIPECTNLAVGYYDQHTMHETQDLSFATRLVNRLIAVDWEALPTERDKTVVEDLWADWSGYHTSRWINDSPANREIDAMDPDMINMIDMIAEHPAAVAALLEQLGYDAYELERAICSYI